MVRSQSAEPNAPGWPTAWPWHDRPDILGSLHSASTAVVFPISEGGSLLVSSVSCRSGRWFIWLESRNEHDWTDAEKAALTLVGQILARGLAEAGAGGGSGPTTGFEIVRQQGLEETAAMLRRLTHDFSNVLMGVVGFARGFLNAQVAYDPIAREYVQEIQRSAELGSEWCRRLRLFTRSPVLEPEASSLVELLTQEEKDWQRRCGNNTLTVHIPANLPDVAIDDDGLRQLLGCLLDNAREALADSGHVTLTARAVNLVGTEGLDLLGSPVVGTAVKIEISDNGRGLAAGSPPTAVSRIVLQYQAAPPRNGLRPAVWHPAGVPWRFPAGEWQRLAVRWQRCSCLWHPRRYRRRRQSSTGKREQAADSACWSWMMIRGILRTRLLDPE